MEVYADNPKLTGLWFDEDSTGAGGWGGVGRALSRQASVTQVIHQEPSKHL